MIVAPVFLLIAVLGLGAFVSLSLWGISSMVKRKQRTAAPEELSKDKRRRFLHQCDRILHTFQAAGNSEGATELGGAIQQMYHALVAWRQHLAKCPAIPQTAQRLPMQWKHYEAMMMQALEARGKDSPGSTDAVQEVIRSFAGIAEDYQHLLDEVERGKTNDLVVDARVLQRLAEMDDALQPHRSEQRRSEFQ